MRLADLEAQMEFNYAKHVQLMMKQKQLRAQYEVLENLPVGIDALQAELLEGGTDYIKTEMPLAVKTEMNV
jgi:hypothetical protein